MRRAYTFASLLGLFLSFCTVQAQNQDTRPSIRNFLEGYTELNRNGRVDKVQGFIRGGKFFPGMGIENPSLVELLALGYGAMSAIEKRINDTGVDLANATNYPLNQVQRERALVLLAKRETLNPQGIPFAMLVTEADELQRLLALIPQARRAEFELDARVLRRSRTQYWLSWKLMAELVRRSMNEYDLRGFPNRNLITENTTEAAEQARREMRIKEYIVEKAGELYIGTLKFISLRQNPVAQRVNQQNAPTTISNTVVPGDLHRAGDDKFSWLDRQNFTEHRDAAVTTFLTATPQEIPVYTNDALMPSAQQIAQGYVRVMRESLQANNDAHRNPNSALMRLNLSTPTDADKQALAQQVLGANILQGIDNDRMRKTAGLVILYLHALAVLVDSFNVNTHDSFELTRATLLTLFRHVIDIRAHSNWPQTPVALRQALDYRPFPNDPQFQNFKPLTEIIVAFQARRFEIFRTETRTGPRLDDAIDLAQRTLEFEVYHGTRNNAAEAIRDIFGTDYSHYNWPRARAYQNRPADDERLKTSIERQHWLPRERPVPEIRGANGDPIAEAQDIKPGSVWGELGTGIGSQLIARATVSATPKNNVRSFITQPSVWSIAREKLYGHWTRAVSWLTGALDTFGLGELTAPLRPGPGSGIDYGGLSHLGLVDRYSVEGYPQFTTADFSDAFPNRMRKAWRAHGFGFSHARKAMVFQMRDEFMAEYIEKFGGNGRPNRNLNEIDAKLNQKLAAIPQAARAPWAPHVTAALGATGNVDGIYHACRAIFANNAQVTAQLSDYENVDAFRRARRTYKPIYELCLAAWQKRGMKNFETRILARGRAGNWTPRQYVEAAGEEVVLVSYGIRNQTEDYQGFGVLFDNNFDTMTKSKLYCSEFVHLTWLIGTGLEVLPTSRFRGVIKTLLETLPATTISAISGGFDKVPYTQEDDVFAPMDIYVNGDGRKVWRAVMEQRRAFYGVNDE